MGRVHAYPALAKSLDAGAVVQRRSKKNRTQRVGSIPIDVATELTAESTARLVEVVLGCSRPAARRILDRAGSLSVLGRCSPRALAERLGISRLQAEQLRAVFELGRRRLIQETAPRASLSSPAAVAEWLRPRMAGLAHEELWLLALDTHCRLQGACRVAQGFSSATPLVIPVVLRRALEMGAAGIILAHNHPGGTLQPSDEDILLTVHLYNAAAMVRLVLVDHLIVGGEGYLSMSLQRLIPERPIPAITALCPEADYAGPPDWVALMECESAMPAVRGLQPETMNSMLSSGVPAEAIVRAAGETTNSVLGPVSRTVQGW